MTHPIIKEFQTVFNSLDASNVDLVERIYTDDIVFGDPVHTLNGMEQLKPYFRELYTNVKSCKFEWNDVTESDGKAYVAWVMALEHPKLNGGRQIRVPGVSALRFQDKITHHQDYFDLGAMLYENVWGLGAIIRKIKSQLA